MGKNYRWCVLDDRAICFFLPSEKKKKKKTLKIKFVTISLKTRKLLSALLSVPYTEGYHIIIIMFICQDVFIHYSS